MANFNGIIFNEVAMPSFVKVQSIKHSILPPVSQTFETVAGKAGSHDFGNSLGNREISVGIQLIAPEPNVLPELLTQLAQWLYYDEPKELILGDNPGKYYFAKLSGDTQIDEEFLVGSGELTFVCSDPYIYGDSYDYILPTNYDGKTFDLMNTGTAETQPLMEFTIAKDLTGFSAVTSTEVVDLGTPYEDTTDETPMDYKGYLLKDTMNSLNSWSNAGADTLGTVTGTFEVDDSSQFRQSALDYGTGATWHGGSMVRPLTQTAQNFEARYNFRITTEADAPYVGVMKFTKDATIKIRKYASTGTKGTKKQYKAGDTVNVYSKSYYKGEGVWLRTKAGNYIHYDSSIMSYADETETYKVDKMGANSFYLTDENSAPIFRATVSDSTAKARALKAVFVLYSATGNTKKTVMKVSIPDKYDNAEGYWDIKRKGKTWYVKLYLEDRWGFTHLVAHKKYTDTAKTYYRPVAKAQVSLMGYSTNPVCYMTARSLYVTNLDKELADDDAPTLILRAGDVLTIDNEKGTILKNGKAFYEFLNPASEFISLGPGSNGFAVSPSDAFSEGTITITEKFL